MGKNNRTRRAAKKKRRTTEHEQHRTHNARAGQPTDSAPGADSTFSTAELVERLFDLAAAAPRARDSELVSFAVARLCTLDRSAVNREAERQILLRIGAAWNGGWQPREVARQVRRTADATTGDLVLVAIAGDHARRHASTLHPRWVEQLNELDLPADTGSNGWLAGWAGDALVTRPDEMRAVVALLRSLNAVSPIPILIPPPGARAGHGPIIDAGANANDPMLDRVRALLAQAESTKFEAEAETFTAKAQELMTRHAIDMAMVSPSAQRADRPGTIRIPIDEPYVDAKSLLLQFVAESSRCQAVFHPRFAMSSVVGFAADLAATETLFTSLLVQAQVALHATAAAAASGARTRSRSFRSAFLTAYAHRVAERLAEINRYVVADAEVETGRSILPVLAARAAHVEATVGEMFGRLGTTTVRGGHVDAAGWASGQMAADRAQLNSGDLPRPIPALSAPEPRS